MVIRIGRRPARGAIINAMSGLSADMIAAPPNLD
jgi:hypothetical protein